ncbi:helix-turn-helix domain-containing protein [Novosphingobium endophyticum]|nr:hypothetical protein [Novosphingobium endophyticum]
MPAKCRAWKHRAAMLGYAEQSSFGRAFKRWTDITPQQFREGQRACRVN